MSSEWKTYRIDELAQVKSGKRLPLGHSLCELPTRYPYIRLVDIVDGNIKKDNLLYLKEETKKIIEKYIVNSDDVCLAIVGNTIGLVFYVENKFNGFNLTENAARITKFKEFVNSKFIYYYLISPIGQNEIVSRTVGSAQGKLPLYNINSFPVNLPPRYLQDAIAEFLSYLDERVSLLRETNITLEAIAQALFKSWFVDFDPVHAKQQGRAPEGMDEATAALFPDSFEESELGMVPKGWRLVPFGECLTHTIGGDWGSDAPEGANDTRVAIIRGTDIPDLQACGESRVPIRFTSQKKLKNRELKVGDIVIEVSGGSKDQPTGRSILMTPEILSRFDCPVEPASFCRLFRPSEMGLSYLLAQHLVFIYAQGKTWEYQNQSTGIANFQTTHFLETELVAVPTDDVLKKFCEIVEPMVKQMYGSQIEQLTKLRDTLLPRLISGQLRLPEAQAAVEGAL